MKIRTRLVSNSSSSSFIAVMHRGTTAIKAICKAHKIPRKDEALWEILEEKLDYKGCNIYGLRGDLLLFLSDPDGIHIGMDIYKPLADDLCLSQIKADMASQLLLHYNVVVDPKDITLEYGEWSSE